MKNKYLFAILFLLSGMLMKSQYAASNFTLISNIDPETGVNNSGDKYSGCWGWYQASKNKEYAIACSKSGTYWIDISNPTTPTVSAYKGGTYVNAMWREAKTYQNYCYVVSDVNTPNSFQIFDMQYLPDSVSKIYDGKTLFETAHTLWVDGNKLYVASPNFTNNTGASMAVYSLANPTSPTLLRMLDQDYPFIQDVHDMYVRNDTVYASCGTQGLYVFKLTSTNTFSQIASFTGYQASAYNHSSALTPNGQTLVFADELPSGLPIKVTNVSNLNNIQISATINQFGQTTPHNPFVVSNQYCFVSSYVDGLQLYDISNPTFPFLAGYFDTYPQSGGNTGSWVDWKGLWGAYPYFPSKVIFGLDMNNGVFLLRTSLYANPAVVSAFTHPTPLCEGSAMSFSNTTSGATNYTWTFSGASVNTSTLANPTVSFTSAGIQTITLFASNPSYTSTSTQTINVPGNANIVATSSTINAACATCSNGVASLTLSGGVAPYTYTWAPMGGNSSSASNLSPDCYTITIVDAALCSSNASLCISFDLPNPGTGINKATSGLNHLTVYPNPASIEVTVTIESGSFTASVYDQTGRLLIKKWIGSESLTIPVNHLAKGVYLLELDNGTDKARRKLVIE